MNASYNDPPPRLPRGCGASTSTRSNFYTGQKLGSKSHFYGRAAAEEVLASSLSALLRAGRARRGFSRSYHPVRGAARFVPKRAMLAVTSLSKQQMRSALALHAAASSMRGRRCDGRCGIGHRTTYRTPVIGRAALEEVLAHFLSVNFYGRAAPEEVLASGSKQTFTGGGAALSRIKIRSCTCSGQVGLAAWRSAADVLDKPVATWKDRSRPGRYLLGGLGELSCEPTTPLPSALRGQRCACTPFTARTK